MTKPGVLYITYGYPWPLNSGMRLRDYHLIRAVSSRFAVSLLSLMERPEEAQHLEALHPYCASVDAVLAERRSKTHRVVGLTGCVLRNRPVQTHMLGYPAMSAKVREIAEKQDVRIAQIEHSYMAHFAEALPPGHRCRTILDFQDVGFVQYRRMLGLRGSLVRKARYVLEWWSANRWEIRYAQRFDQCVAVSPDDAQALRRASPDLAVAVVDNGVDTDDLRPLPEAPGSRDLLFVGTMSYMPNIDAVLYFARCILPLIQRRIPGTRLVVVGKSPPESIRRLASRSDVVVTGSVPDVQPYYAASAVSVVPLRAGSGTRLKILEAMALGRPVVSTPVGSEGLEVVDGQHLLLADEPEAFADRVVALLEGSALCADITARARSLVEERYSWPVLGERLMAVYDGLL